MAISIQRHFLYNTMAVNDISYDTIVEGETEFYISDLDPTYEHFLFVYAYDADDVTLTFAAGTGPYAKSSTMTIRGGMMSLIRLNTEEIADNHRDGYFTINEHTYEERVKIGHLIMYLVHENITTTNVTYDGVTTSLSTGDYAVLKTKGKVATSDIIVEVNGTDYTSISDDT